jgi:hypothetical protein
MLDLFFHKDYLKHYPDYPLHPNCFNLRPDKITTFKLGIGTSPEGWWDCTTYGGKDGSYKDWMVVCWTVDETPDRKISFWIKALSYIGKDQSYTFPDPPKADAFYLEVVDWDGPKSMGYGKEWKSTVVYSIDDVFKWIKDHHILSKFFFEEKEMENLKLDDYDKDGSRRRAWKPKV